MSGSTTPAGWYPDPENAAQQRYWDGAQWTADFAPTGAEAPAETGAALPSGSATPVLAPKSRVVAAVLAIVLGGIGAHKFYLGKTQAGLIHIGMALVGICGAILLLPLFLLIASYFIAIAEGVIYLTKTDEQFEAIYVRGDKSWF